MRDKRQIFSAYPLIILLSDFPQISPVARHRCSLQMAKIIRNGHRFSAREKMWIDRMLVYNTSTFLLTECCSLQNLSMDKHVTSLSAKCLFQLRQPRRIRRSLDDDSVATLVHAFVANRVDCGVGLLAGSPKKTTAKLQRVFNAAARVVSNCGKYSTIEDQPISGAMYSTGWMSQTGLGFACAFRCTSVDTVIWLLDT